MEKQPAGMNGIAAFRLMSWLSPSFPIGTFAYSAGLEQAIADKCVYDASSLGEWLKILTAHGVWWNDAVLCAAAWKDWDCQNKVIELAGLGEALAGSYERRRETMDQGKAFAKAVRHWFGTNLSASTDLPLPVAIGLACGKGGMALEPVLAAYLNALVSNQLQCAIRLSVIGQDGASELLSALETEVIRTALRAGDSTLDNLGSCAIASEIASMNHETLQPRLFLS